MDLTGSAQRLMDTIQRWTSPNSYTDVLDELEVIAEEPQKFDGRAVEGALIRVARQSGWWETVKNAFVLKMRWICPEKGRVVQLGPLEGFTLED